MFTGDGANGKSQLLNLMKHVMGVLVKKLKLLCLLGNEIMPMKLILRRLNLLTRDLDFFRSRSMAKNLTLVYSKNLLVLKKLFQDVSIKGHSHLLWKLNCFLHVMRSQMYMVKIPLYGGEFAL